ncbi:hypothetical protein E3N88_14239 [Mikania micrantha]|uniref:Methyltransferase type 11 domain-containing protein n=1 Tax=Mikania micrantha TaxID=192012 RepID=A0A5N6P0Y1_9ASTR|nr:hypothetical protein E3N88_14239 [Mikania micrantha]
MFMDESACNTYNYGDSVYWDARYINEASAGSFDWYQRYHALRPFVRKYIPTSSRVLMVGCGNAVMSEDMVKDGYENIMNVDISCVAIEMMRRKYENVPQLKYLQMDVRDMGFFLDDSFDSVIDKGLDLYLISFYLCILLVDTNHTINRIILQITYGDPTVRMPHINRPVYNWKIDLYIIPRPGFEKPPGSTSSPKSHVSPVPTTDKGMLPADYILEDPDSHFIYVCTKMPENPLLIDSPAFSLAEVELTDTDQFHNDLVFSVHRMEMRLEEVTTRLELTEARLGLVEARAATAEAMVEAIAEQVAVEPAPEEEEDEPFEDEEDPVEDEQEEPFEDEEDGLAYSGNSVSTISSVN